MSVRVMGWVWTQECASPSDKLVLLAIADHAGHDGANAWPSQAELVAMTSLSDRTVRRAIDRLTDAGLLRVDSRYGAARGRLTDVYTVVMDQPVTVTGSSVDLSVTTSGSSGASTGHSRHDLPVTVTGSSKEDPSNEPSKVTESLPTVETPVSSNPRVNTQVTEVWDAYRASTGRNGAYALTPKRQRLITSALTWYPLADVLDAVDGWRCVAFNRGDNADRRVWNDLELILRDAEHIERFRDAKRGGGTATPADDYAWAVEAAEEVLGTAR